MTTAAAATAKPFDMLDALAEGLKCDIDRTNSTIRVKFRQYSKTASPTLTHIVLKQLSEHTGSLWVMPTLDGFPFECPETGLWTQMHGSKVTEKPPILRLEHATLKLFSELIFSPETTTLMPARPHERTVSAFKPSTAQLQNPPPKQSLQYAVRYNNDGRSKILSALRGILSHEFISTYIFPYYTRQPEPQLDKYYIATQEHEVRRCCRLLSYFPFWQKELLEQARSHPDFPSVKQASIARTKRMIESLGATPCTRLSIFGDAEVPWIQYDAGCFRIVAHINIGNTHALLVNYLGQESVQKYALTPPEKPGSWNFYTVVDLFERVAIPYSLADNIVVTHYRSVVEEYSKTAK